ncbi:MAG: hypothetical protein DRJ03_00605 [Chloroflexi bacterium]|nr:MAG: hypothetical protein DRJ03_00605 [Chloroflexota bacterium]
MAATIITVAQIGASGTNIKIKVNENHPVPSQIMTDAVQSFRTWTRDQDHIFVWTNSKDQELSMTVPFASIGWILSAMPIGIEGDRFRIDAPCAVVVEPDGE